MTQTKSQQRAATGRSTVPFRDRVERRWFGVALLVLAAMAGVLASLAFGSRVVPVGSVVDALTAFDAGSPDHVVVRDLRVPRTVLAVLVGAALPMAGALMQAITRNPLAGPGLLGINSGAALAVVSGAWMIGISDISQLVWLALVGAVVSAIIVYSLGSVGRGASGPVRLALAGAAVTALMFAVTRAITLIDRVSLEQYRFWAVGSLTGRFGDVIGAVLPFLVVGSILAVALARSLNTLALGEDNARALGSRVGLTRAASGLAIVLLAGGSVAAAGPILFVGLVVPHMARSWFGPDQRWLLPTSALLGAVLILTSDTLGRVVARPSEIHVGIVMAAVGGPIFVWLVRRMREVTL